MKLLRKGIFRLRICKYFSLYQHIKFVKRKALIEVREEHLKNKLQLVNDRDEFLQNKLGIVKNLIDYQLELNAVSETQLKIIREFLGEPVLEKLKGLNINIAQSEISNVILEQTTHDQKENLGEQTGDP